MGSTTESPTQLPIIDLTPFLSPTSTPQSRLQCAKSLVHACHTTGFIYITNHGIPPALLSEAFSWSKEFFALSEEEKSQASHPPGSNVFRGYSKVGHEMIPEMEGEKVKGVVDFNESYGMGHDDNKGQPNVWLPDSILPGYRVFVDKFYSECWKTSTSVLRALALGLELESEDYLLQFHSEIENELTFRHYPPVDAGKVKSGEMDRLGAHTDFDSFTLLWQGENAGLEVKVRDLEGKGEWRSVDFVEGALVMNIGDVLSRWSNDYLISTLHRVHLPTYDHSYITKDDIRMTKPRYSIPYFVVPKNDMVLKPLEGFFTEGKEKRYEPLSFTELYEEKVKGYFEPVGV